MSVEHVPGQRVPKPALWPVLDRSSIQFWDSVKARKMAFQRCKNCQTYIHPARPMCPKCHSDGGALEWVPTGGKGRIYSMATYRQADHPSFKVPYTVVVVEMDEGVRLVSNMADDSKVTIGMRVELVYDDVAQDLTLPKFRKMG